MTAVNPPGQTPLRPRETAAAARTWEIVAAATTLFARQGFVATSMDEIAEAAQVTKRTVYRHMRSKDGVLLAIHQRMIELSSAALADSMPPETTCARDELAGYVKAHVEVMTTYATEATVFLEQMKYLSPEHRAEVVAHRDDYEAAFRAVIEKGIRSGEFSDCSSAIVAQVLLGALNYLYRWYRPDGTLTSDDIADIVLCFVLHGLRGLVGETDTSSASVADKLDGIRRDASDLTSQMSGKVVSAKFGEVVDAATALFAERGYQGSSSSDIAEAAHLGKGALYYHIDGKASLLSAVLYRAMSAAEASLSEAIVGTPPVEHVDLLRRVIVEQCRDIARRQIAVRVTLEEFRYLSVEESIELTGRQRAFQGLLARVIALSGTPQSISPERLQVVTSLEIGAIVFLSRWFHSSGPRSIDDISHEIAAVIELGIASTPN